MGFELGFHASHEQFLPSELLEWVERAEAAGFAHAMCSDHFAPFTTAQGNSGHAWTWLGAALARTHLDFGTVNAPGQRYHPAVIAQAAATLAEMFPERFWLALGSGENLNEHITFDRWPGKPQRQARLKECVDVLRALFAGETVTHDGLIRVDRAKLYSLPKRAPLLFGAAVSPETAAWVATWADGLISVNQSPETQRRVTEAFLANGGEGKPMFLQVHVAYAPNREEALSTAHEHWRAAPLGAPLLWDVALPEEVDTAARFVRREDMRDSVRLCCDMYELFASLRADHELGFSRIYLHEVGRQQQRFLDALAPHLASYSA